MQTKLTTTAVCDILWAVEGGGVFGTVGQAPPWCTHARGVNNRLSIQEAVKAGLSRLDFVLQLGWMVLSGPYSTTVEWVRLPQPAWYTIQYTGTTRCGCVYI